MRRTQKQIPLTYLPVLTNWIQSPWFLNFRGMSNRLQPSPLHSSLSTGGPVPTGTTAEISEPGRTKVMVSPSMTFISWWNVSAKKISDGVRAGKQCHRETGGRASEMARLRRRAIFSP